MPVSVKGGAVWVFLESERLVLRRLTERDADHLVDLDSDPEVMRFLTGGKPTPRAVIENDHLPRLLSEYDRFGGLGHWAAIEKHTGAFLGWFALCPSEDRGPRSGVELGYRLRRSAWAGGTRPRVRAR